MERALGFQENSACRVHIRKGGDLATEVVPSGNGRFKRFGFSEASLTFMLHKILKQRFDETRQISLLVVG